MASNRPGGSNLIGALQFLAVLALAGLVLYGCAWFFARIPNLVIILIASIFFAYLIFPITDRLAKRMPALVALLVVYLGMAILIALVVLFAVPPLVSDATTFVKGIPKILSDLSNAIADPHNPLFAWLPESVRLYLANLPEQLVTLAERYGFAAVQQITGYLLSAVAVIATVVIVPVLTAYMLMDREDIVSVFLSFFPKSGRPKAKAVLDDLDRVLGGFIRGQIIDALIVGVSMFIVLTIFRVPYAYLIAVFTGIFQVVPYLGAVVAFVPAVTLALIYNGTTNGLLVALAIVAVHQIDGNIIAPRIMKDNVGLSPFWMIVSVLAFTELFGFVGTFVAVPAAAMIRVLKIHFVPTAVKAVEGDAG